MFLSPYMKCRQQDWLKISRTDMVRKIKNKNTNFEVIRQNTQCKLILDLDNKDLDKSPLTTPKINYICIQLIEFIKIKFNQINQNRITTSVKVSITPTELINKITEYNSIHIVVNCYTNSLLEQKQFIQSFKNYLCECGETELSGYIDLRIYSNNRLIRTLNSNKDKSRQDFFVALINNQLLSIGELSKNEIEDFFISDFDKDKNIFLNLSSPNNNNIYIVNDKIINDTFSIECVNNQEKINYINDCDFDKFKKYIKTLKNQSSSEWYKNVFTLSQIINQDNKNKIQHQDLINQFLNVERLEKYKNSIDNDRKIILATIKNNKVKNQNYKFFVEIEKEEIEFIKSHISTPLKSLNVENLNVVFNQHYPAKNKSYLLKINNSNIIYDCKTKILCENAVIKTIRTEKNKLKKIVVKQSPQEYSFYIDKIFKTKQHNSLKNKINFFMDWNELITNINQNEYVVAPTSSGKSYFRMNKLLEQVFKKNKSKVIFVCDTKAMVNKTYSSVINLINKDFVYHYLKDKKIKLNKHHRAIVITYDSLYKHKYTLLTTFKATHLFIDEIVNVLKRIVNNSKDKKYEKINMLDQFCNTMKKTIVKFFDADYDKQTETILKLLSKKEIVVNKMVNFIQYNNIIKFQNEKKSIKEIHSLLKQKLKITISISTKKRAFELFEEFSINDNKILRITSGEAFVNKETIEGIDNDIIKDPTKFFNLITTNTSLWELFNVVIYTTTITTGISIDKENIFYKHYSFLSKYGGDTQQEAQFNCRVRKLQSKTITIVNIGDTNLLSENRSDKQIEDIVNKKHLINENNNNTFISDCEEKKYENFEYEYIEEPIATQVEEEPEIEEEEEEEEEQEEEMKNYFNDYIEPSVKQHLNNIIDTIEKHNSIIEEKKLHKAYHICKRLLDWGCQEIISDYFDMVNDIDNKNVIIDNDIVECYNMELNDWKQTKSIKKFNNNEYNDIDNRTIQQRQENWKSLISSQCGFSNYFINYLFDNDNDNHNKLFISINSKTYQNNYKNFSRYYNNFQMKDIIIMIYNCVKSDKMDFNKDRMLNVEVNKRTRPVNMKHLYCCYIVIKIHELLNITNQDIIDFLTNKNKIEIEKSNENIDKLKSLFSETEWIYNYISLNYTDKNGHKFSRAKKELDKNAKIYDMVVKAFNDYGINVIVGQTKRNNENIVIYPPTENYRIQKYYTDFIDLDQQEIYTYTDLYDYNENDYKNISPLLPLIKEDYIINFINRFAIYFSALNKENLLQIKKEKFNFENKKHIKIELEVEDTP